MIRGELYRVYRGSRDDPRNFRVFAVVSRQALVDSRFSTAICAPVFSSFDGLSTQVQVGVDEGLKHASSIFCGPTGQYSEVRVDTFYRHPVSQ